MGSGEASEHNNRTLNAIMFFIENEEQLSGLPLTLTPYPLSSPNRISATADGYYHSNN